MYNAHYTISNTGSNHKGNKFSCNYSNKDVWSYFNILARILDKDTKFVQLRSSRYKEHKSFKFLSNFDAFTTHINNFFTRYGLLLLFPHA